MKKNPFATLTIAGSDSIGGAGIQADIKTMSALGCYATSCITAITAQNTMGVKRVEAISSQLLFSQIICVLEDMNILATKTGMIYTAENVFAIKHSLTQMNYKGKLIIDPVLIATSGDALAREDFIQTLVQELFSMADLVTPNLYEAETISKVSIKNKEDMTKSAKKIQSLYGAKNVLIKGGHLQENEMTDVLLTSEGEIELYSLPKLEANNTHGTGCSLSSAICSFLALGQGMQEAIFNAKNYVHTAIKEAKGINLGHGHGSLNHFFAPQKMKTI
ncbi:MAG: bifunctional hydroxymethylpyrimidine kinase/phosphomethylpyrimidine kinase [Bacteroidota bacterium]|nr:bifunctional hydroxymethylpyrimidine kinase/phosphomethylpyrimidine kinase [Bacteroidota bacterium]